MLETLANIAQAILVVLATCALIGALALLVTIARAVFQLATGTGPKMEINGIPVKRYYSRHNDTIVKIAVEHDQNWKELMELNGMSSPDQFKPGMCILIPTAKEYNK